MINTDKLKQVLTQYKADFPSWWEQKEEKYKWIAVQHFQDHWDIKAENFGAMFKEATKMTKNLLNSKNNLPGKMIGDFAKFDDKTTREMFRALFDESVDLNERVTAFQAAAEKMRTEYNEAKPANKQWKNHYQYTNAISTYLWLRYPNQYYIYKPQLAGTVSDILHFDSRPQEDRTVESMMAGYRLYGEIRNAIESDKTVCELIRNAVKTTSGCYSDPQFVTAATDVAYYIGTHYAETNWLPFPEEYSPNLSVQDWIELLKDKSVFNENSLQIMARMKDYGGEATCIQLSEKYGKKTNFYNSGSSSLAKRVHKKTDCPVIPNGDNNKKWWPILYLGKKAPKNTKGEFLWKLRDELREALEQTDLSSVKLFEDGVAAPEASSEPDSGNGVHGYWWLIAKPAIWSFSSVKVGEEQNYTLLNDNGNKRRIFENFLKVKEGDPVICYEANPVKQIVAIGKITRANDGTVICFKKTEDVPFPVDYATLKECPELGNMEFFKNPNGSLFKLTKDEYDSIMDMIHDSTPLEQTEPVKPYSVERFLSDVYMEESDYKDLMELLLNKKNIILQGAPGVGKTFAAKRLAYSIMGRTDISKIEFVQFHQNTSYEDFVQGYRPDGENFVLKYGIFYRFCKKAANDPENKYFFIIDEINRGNLSKIFGELLMLIENDKRMNFGTDGNGEDSGLEEYSVAMAYTGERFSVPENVHIIGMMNTADRSLAMIDYALRRRFSFFEMKPAFDSDGFQKKKNSFNNTAFDNLIGTIRELNRQIEKELGSGFQIGHSYFCEKPEDISLEKWMEQIVKYDIIPLLEEYWFDEPEKTAEWKGKLLDVIKSVSGETQTAPSQDAPSGDNTVQNPGQ